MSQLLKHHLNRRKLIEGSLALGAGAFLTTLPGCASIAPQVIPFLIHKTLDELYALAKTYFQGTFSQGEVLTERPKNCPLHEGPFADSIHKGFLAIQAEHAFCTPIVLSQRGRNRYLQLAVEGGLWSIISGGRNNESVFYIHKSFLNWLLSADNCNLRVNGNSTFESCGVNGCGLRVNRQDFLDVNSQIVKLQYDVPNGPNDPERTRHVLEGHTKKWLGCPEVTGNPEVCVF